MIKEFSELELYRTVTSMTGDVIFSYDIVNDVMHFYSDRAEMSKYGSQINNFFSLLENTKSIKTKELQIFEMIHRKMVTGESGYFDIKTKLPGRYSNNKLYRITGKTVYDSDNCPESIVGRIVELEEQEIDKQEENLNIDQLTGLLADNYFRAAVSDYMISNSNNEDALYVIINVDNFRNVCMQKEQETESEILINVAQRIKRVFTENAIIGRVGYDEFAVFYHGGNTTHVASCGVQLLLDEIKKIQTGDEKIKITASAGIYCGPIHSNYYEFHEKARVALLVAKLNGKNRKTIYSKNMNVVNCENRDEEPKEIFQSIEKLIYSSAIEMMAEYQNFDKVINMIIEKTGSLFDIDRVVIHTSDDERQQINITYEWKNPDASEYMYYPYEDKADYDEIMNIYQSGNEEYIDDVLKVMNKNRLYRDYVDAGIRSLAQYVITDDAYSIKAVEFENYRNMHKWTMEEKRALRGIAKVISAFRLYFTRKQIRSLEVPVYNSQSYLLPLNKFLEKSEEYIKINSSSHLAVVNIKITNITEINRIYGYEAGNRVLKFLEELLQDDRHRFIMASRVCSNNFTALGKMFDNMGNPVMQQRIKQLESEFKEFCLKCCIKAEASLSADIKRINYPDRPIREYINSSTEENEINSIEDQSCLSFQDIRQRKSKFNHI